MWLALWFLGFVLAAIQLAVCVFCFVLLCFEFCLFCVLVGSCALLCFGFGVLCFGCFLVFGLFMVAICVFWCLCSCLLSSGFM